MVRPLNLNILNKHTKCEGKWARLNTKNSNEKSIIDYSICSKTLLKNIMKVLIDDQETCKIKGKSKSDHKYIHNKHSFIKYTQNTHAK